jgi:hypothetical protein
MTPRTALHQRQQVIDAVAAVAAAGGLLMLPGMKAARLIFQASSAHAWAERNCIDFKWYQMLLMRLVFILPGLTAMLWVSGSAASVA